MSHEKHEPAEFNRFKSVRRTAVRISQEELVSVSHLDPDRKLPLVMKPNVENVNLVTWAENNRETINRELATYGAILFRGFNLSHVEKFEQFIEASSGELLKYTERSSPRSLVSGHIYTSTDYPPHQSIFPHNEQSYNISFPMKIFFFCVQRAEQGGETPIADTRKIFARLDRKIRDRFIEKKYMYVRNFGDGFGLSWQTAFQTTDRFAVEQYCRSHDIQFEWKDGNRLRTHQVRPVAAKHPRTGEMVWFNHLTFFHISTLEPKIRAELLSQFKEEDLPNNTYYGDGTPVEPSVMDELRDAYLQETVAFSWHSGDVLMLDNMLMSHARNPFTGPRKVVVGMAEPFNWKNLVA